MSNESDNDEVDEQAPVTEGPLAGERLAEARRAQQISVDEVAKELHLDEYKVRALEQNEFDVLGAPVFAKGHMRKYAQLVGVNMDDVLADYYQLTRSAPVPPVVGNVRKPGRELSPGPWLAVLIALIIIASLYWYFVARVADDVTTPATATDTVDDAASSNEIQSTEQRGLPADEPVDQGEVLENTQPAEVPGENAALTGQVGAEPAPPAAAVSEPTLADGEVRLTMLFSGDCWTEITDGSGRKLFFDLGRDGRTASITGRAPLAVLFGNAENVSVRVNGEPYPIDERDRRGRTARLTIRAAQ